MTDLQNNFTSLHSERVYTWDGDRAEYKAFTDGEISTTGYIILNEQGYTTEWYTESSSGNHFVSTKIKYDCKEDICWEKKQEQEEGDPEHPRGSKISYKWAGKTVSFKKTYSLYDDVELGSYTYNDYGYLTERFYDFQNNDSSNLEYRIHTIEYDCDIWCKKIKSKDVYYYEDSISEFIQEYSWTGNQMEYETPSGSFGSSLHNDYGYEIESYFEALDGDISRKITTWECQE